jgi:hypothetical protein
MSEPDLNVKAKQLWPTSERLRREWLRAVFVVRSTARGWVVDRQMPKLEVPSER